MTNWLQQLDDRLYAGLAEWNAYSTILVLLIVTILVYPAFFSPEPDIHPLLLARQSSGSRVRQPGESATFRSLDVPHSFGLRTGLNVKEPDQPRYQPGRDGDLRDIWRKAVNGSTGDDGEENGKKGKISVVLGKEEVIEYEMDALSKEVNAIGKHLRQHGGSRVAIYLSNSVEFLVALFACNFFNLTPILIPRQPELDSLATLLKETNADILLVGAGAIPLAELVNLYSCLKQVVWVVARTSRHMDWHEVPEGEGGKASVGVWHEIIEESAADAELPTSQGQAPNLITVARRDGDKGANQLVEFTQGNLVAAVAAQRAVLPRAYSSKDQHHLKASDTLLSVAPLTDPYPLILTLAALYSNASLALTTVCGPHVKYATIFQGVSPTIAIVQPPTLSRLCAENKEHLPSAVAKYFHDRRLRTLKNGSLPKLPLEGGVRLIYTYDNSYSGRGALSQAEIDDLRVFTCSRIIFAHTAPNVAGAISQTNLLDYQDDEKLSRTGPTHLGPPLSCLEAKLKSADDTDVDDNDIRGKPVVTGPAVVGGKTTVDEILRITDRRVFAYGS